MNVFSPVVNVQPFFSADWMGTDAASSKAASVSLLRFFVDNIFIVLLYVGL